LSLPRISAKQLSQRKLLFSRRTEGGVALMRIKMMLRREA